MIKVLILDNSMYPTGAFYSLMKLIDDLKHRIEFTVVFPENSTCTKMASALSIDSRELPFLEISKSLAILKYRKRLRQNAKIISKWIDDDRYDLIHVNDIYNLLGVELKKQGVKIKLVQHVRLLKNSYIKTLYPFFSKKIIKRADAIVGVSQCVLNDLPTTPKKELIYNGLSREEIHSEFICSDHKEDHVVMGYFGRLMPGKGQLMALTSFKMAFKKNDRLRLRFVGGLPDESSFGNELRSFLEEHGLTKVVSFKSFTDDVEKEMKSVDIVVNFSLSESFSRICLDALYFGVPLISSDCGGPSELFENGKSGMLVENRNVDQLSVVMLKLAGDFELRKEFSDAGKQYVREKFSKENTSEKLALLYQKLLKS